MDRREGRLSVIRHDLLALDSERLAALANRGLVKRAEKMLDGGQAPWLTVQDDGTVLARDGDIQTTLAPGVALADTLCTCNSFGICRHRVSAVLAYARSTPRPESQQTDWSPGQITDTQLEALLGRRMLARARSQVERGMLAEVHRGAIPRVDLATTRVSFLVPHHLEHARCDCSEASSCVHLAFAVWAFRLADRSANPGPSVTVSLSAAGLAPTRRLDDESPANPIDDRSSIQANSESEPSLADKLWEPSLRLIGQLLTDGVAHAGSGLGAALVRAQASLEKAGWAWPAEILRELAESLQLYSLRSAAYESGRVVSLIAEFQARRMASRGGGELPPRVVLGLGESGETTLKRVDLVCLGVKVRSRGEGLRAEVFLADPSTATVLVLRKDWKEPGLTGPEVAHRSLLSGVPLSRVACGQLVTGNARRRPERLLILARAAGSLTSVLPQAGNWENLPRPIHVDDFQQLREEIAQGPPPPIRPRFLADGVRVLVVAGVGEVRYSRATQTLEAKLLDRRGHVFRLRQEYQTLAPGALDALARALESEVRFVSGRVCWEGGLHLQPLTVVGERMHVLDLSTDTGAPLPDRGHELDEPSALDATLRSVRNLLSEACHRGLRHLSRDWPARAAELSHVCQGHGLTELGQALSQLVESTQNGSPAVWLEGILLAEMTAFYRACSALGGEGLDALLPGEGTDRAFHVQGSI